MASTVPVLSSRSLCLLLVLICVSTLMVDAFFFDKLERLKKVAFPSAFSGLSSLLPGFGSGIRVCINFNSNYPQGYQQNTCFMCDAYRFNQIAFFCTGQQNSIPSNINYTQANCIMNSCQPSMYGQRFPGQTSFGQANFLPSSA